MLSVLATLVIRIFRLTWRVNIQYAVSLPKDRRLVFCFWHGEQASLFAYRHSNPVVVLASLSQDGQLQTQILQRLGFTVCRGSSSRKGAAGLKAVIRKMVSGCDGAFAVDGPRGPAHVAKEGALEAARQAGGLIVPMRTSASSKWVFAKAWDAYCLPKPFARVTIEVGHPALATELNGTKLTQLLENIG